MITLPLSIVAGLATGFALFREPQSLPLPAPNAVRASEKTAQPTAAPDSGADTNAKAERLIAAALRKGSQVERENEVYFAIEAMTAEDLRRLVGNDEAFKAMMEKMLRTDSLTGWNLVSGLIRRWLELDRDAVKVWVPRALDLFPRDTGAYPWILDTLTKRVPEQVLALVSSRKNAEERAEIIEKALNELAAKDSAKARAWVAGCTDPDDRYTAEKVLRQAIVQADPLRAIELVESIKDRSDAGVVLRTAALSAARMGPGMLRQFASFPLKPWMTADVIDVFAKYDPELAVDLAIKSRGDGYDVSATLRDAFSGLAKRDPSLCMAKLEGLEGRELSAAVSATGFTWAASDPAAALSWLLERPAAERNNTNHSMGDRPHDALLFGFAHWAEKALTEARAWADALPPGASRDLLQTEVARALAARGEPAEATRVLASLGKAGDPNTLARLASAWARRDPKAAAEWAIVQESGPAQSRALAGIVGTWANEDQAGVQKWLSQFPPGETRDRSIKSFLWRMNSWTASEEQRVEEFDAWFNLIDDPWHRAQVARSSFWERASRDRAAARAWLSSLENVDPEIVRMTLRDNDP